MDVGFVVEYRSISDLEEDWAAGLIQSDTKIDSIYIRSFFPINNLCLCFFSRDI